MVELVLVAPSLVLLFAVSSAAVVHHVDLDDPTCAGNAPCHVGIQSAVDALGAGDSVRIAAGVYHEQIKIKNLNAGHGASEYDRIVIEADPASPPGSVVLNPGTTECSQGPAVKFVGSRFVTLRGLTITGNAGRAIVLRKAPKANESIRLEGNRIFGNGGASCNGGIVVRDGNEDVVIANNLIYGNGRNGIRMRGPTGGRHVVVGNTLYANGRNGLNADPEIEVLVANNVILRNGTDTTSGPRGFGVRVRASEPLTPAHTQLSNNLICGNRRGELGRPERMLDSADLENWTPTGSEGPGVSASQDCGDPTVVFESLAGSSGAGPGTAIDFTLALGSPAVDSGATPQSLGVPSLLVPVVESDWTGLAVRPRDGNGDGTAEFDRGALERREGSLGTPPSVALTAPADGSIVHASPIVVTGTVEGADAVFVNGVRATLTGTSFSASVPLVEGANAIVAVATNAQGCAEAELLVTLDSPPVVLISTPIDGLQTSATAVEVSGTATDLSGVTSVVVNGQPAPLDGETFTVSLPLVDGDNVLTAIATDTGGITGSATVTVFRADAPTIEIDSVPDGASVANPSLIVSGLATGTDVTVFVNDVVVSVDEEGRFTSTVELLEGPNPVEARAESPFGTDVVVIEVVLDTAPPVAQIDEPADGFSTSLDTILVRGSASDGSGLSTVVVNGVAATVTGSSWSAQVPLALGPNAITVTVTDLAGNTISSTIHGTRELVPLSIDIGSPSNGFATADATIVVSGFVSDSSSTVLVNGVAANVTGSSFTAEIPLSPLTNVVTATAQRGSDTALDEIIVVRSTTSPPDPAPEPESVATIVDPTVATDIASSVAFLYEGPDPIQAVSDPGVFEAKRLSVIRGRILDRSGDGLPGVTVRILDRPEFGTTTTRADGGYDLAVNGGTTYLVDFRRPGSIPAQRRVHVAWREFAIVDDVVILPLDARATMVDFANPTEPIQIHRGSISSDEDGSRQATVFFPAGVSATMRMPDGSTEPLSQGTVRLTEFTVGDLGPNAMPGVLPPESGYTYAVDMCIDEAFVAGATGVDFSEPVPLYVDNFLGFPVGTPAPFGFYDFELGQWVPSDDGVVLRIASIEGGMATVDPALPLSDDERAALAAIYQVGDELWRVPVPHFSEGDINWPRGFPSDADNPPFGSLGFLGSLAGEPDCSQGSIIECETQVLGESIPVVGTPFNLHYRSDRVPGRAAKRTVQIPITTDDPPASLKRVDVTVDVAGQRHELSFPPTPGQPAAEFTWDGKDAYGRDVNGSASGRVRIGWVYNGSYQTPSVIGQSFGQPSETQIELAPSRREAIAVKELTARFGTVDARGWGVGGWTLSPHHFYDPDDKVLYRGDGSKRNTLGTGRVIDRFAGTGFNLSTSGIPGPALDASFGWLSDVAVGADGVVYMTQFNGSRLFRVDPETGTISNVSSPSIGASAGVGLPISDTRLEFPESMDIAPDGSIYVTNGLARNQIRRIDPGGIVRAFAGVGGATTGSGCDEVGNGEGELATEVVFCLIRHVTAAPDGSVYFVDRVVGSGLAGSRIRRITPDGRLHTILGEGDGAVAGMPARRWTSLISSLAVDSEGTLYFADRFRVYRIRSEDSIVELVAGGGDPANGLGDGLPATEVELSGVIGNLTPARDGGIYLTTSPSSFIGRIRHISPGGTIRTIAGNGESGIGGNGRVATRAPLARLLGLAEGPDGTLYVAEQQAVLPLTSQVRAIRSFIPDRSDTEITIPSENGDELYDFDSNGRHLRTRHALTDAELLTFGYDGEGRLVEVREVAPSGDPADDLVTSILREGSGAPIEIVGPYGATTTLASDANGFLDAVSNPKSETHRMRYTSDGLLESFIRPAGGEFRFLYDAKGLLIRDDDPEGGFQTLARVDDDGGYSVTLSSALGVTRVKRVEDGLVAGDGLQRRVRTDPAGLETEIFEIPGEMEIVRTPSGLETEVVFGADPRLGLARPFVEERITRLPSGLVRTESSSRTVTLDPVSRELLAQEDVTTVNDRPTSIRFDAVGLTREIVTPEGRTLVKRLDAQGRTIGVRLGDLEERTFDYDDSGRLVETRQGQGLRERVTTWTRDAAGNIDTISALLDGTPLTSALRYDAANQVESLTSPELSTTEFGYDANGNVTRLRPASQPDHGFGFSDLDLEERYTPPPVSPADPSSHRTYDLDRRPTALLRADGSSITQGYDGFGRLASITIPRGTTTLAYSPTTGLLDRIDAPGGESLVFGYDGPLVTSVVSTGSAPGSLELEYDPDLRVRSESVNGSSGVTFAYDDDSLLVAAGALAIGRDPLTGLVVSTTLGSLTTTRQSDEFGDLEAMATSAGGSGPLYSVIFERDTLGRIVRKLETIEGETTDIEYGYDLDGRLVSVRENGVLVRSYDYDLNGNRLSATSPGGTVSGIYDDQDRLFQYGETIYSHDEAGDLVSRQRPGEGLESFSYDALGNLVGMTRSVDPGGSGGSGGAVETQIEYVIDGQSRRIGKRVDGVLVQGLLYRDALNPVAELDGSGGVVSRFVYGTQSNVPEYMVRGGATYRIVTDHLGSVRLVVDAATGAVVQRLDYDEWGVVIRDTNPGFQPFGFAGGLYDPDTGLTRFGARDYDPEVGRWTTKDPIRFEGGDGNLYGYVLNDPSNNVDPVGLDSFGFGASGALVIGGGGQITVGLFAGSETPGPGEDAVVNGESTVGAFVTGESAVGLLVGAGLEVSFTAGPETDEIAGETTNATGCFGICVTATFSSETGDLIGGAIGGPGFGGLISQGNTGTLELLTNGQNGERRPGRNSCPAE